MSKRKKWIIAAVILLCTGVLICGITFVTLGFDLSKLSTGNYETNIYEIKDTFQDISIQAGTDDVAFKPSEDGKCSVVCYEEENRKHDVRVEDGTLMVTGKDEEGWLSFSLFDFQNPSVTVYLPENEYHALAVDAGTGNVLLPEGFLFDCVHVILSTGDIECSSSANNMLELKATTGDIKAESLTAGDIALSVSTGKIQAASLRIEGKADVQVTTGDAKLEAVTCTDVYSAGSTGDLIMKDVVASGEFHVERTTGRIRFDACDAETIYAKTSTGDVTGTLLSDKVYITDTGTGNVDVPKTSEGGRCEITTGTGDIRISVVE